MANDVPALHNLDLNLLVSADAFLREASVARAARQLGITQPAASQRLARLREMFEDPLLVRRGGRMARTPVGDDLRGPVERVLAEIRSVVARRPAFDPSTARRRFTIATTDYLATVILPALAQQLLAAAPHVGLDVRFLDPEHHDADLDRGLDLALGVLPERPGVVRRLLLRETFLCVVRPGHPMLSDRRGKAAVRRFAALPHVVMSPTGTGPGPVDDALAKVGLARDVLLRVAGFGMAPAVLAATDAVMTLPSRLAHHYARHAGLVACEPPIRIDASFEVHAAWSARNDGDAGIAWLVERLVAASARA